MDIPGVSGLSPAGEKWFVQMFALLLPKLDPEALQRTLLDQHNIEVVTHRWKDANLLRVSLQAHNDEGDCSALVGALAQILP